MEPSGERKERLNRKRNYQKKQEQMKRMKKGTPKMSISERQKQKQTEKAANVAEEGLHPAFYSRLFISSL